MSLGSFVKSVDQKLLVDWDECTNVKETWNTLKTELCDGAKVELGHENRRQPVGLGKVRNIFKPLFSERNRL
jgi:hypothetical protein